MAVSKNEILNMRAQKSIHLSIHRSINNCAMHGNFNSEITRMNKNSRRGPEV